MLYNCDENEKIYMTVYSDCYDFTQWDSQQWWLIIFCTGDIVHNANNYNHEFVNALQIKYSENRPQAQ